jgi:hypothetical protein
MDHETANGVTNKTVNKEAGGQIDLFAEGVLGKMVEVKEAVGRELSNKILAKIESSIETASTPETKKPETGGVNEQLEVPAEAMALANRQMMEMKRLGDLNNLLIECINDYMRGNKDALKAYEEAAGQSPGQANDLFQSSRQNMQKAKDGLLSISTELMKQPLEGRFKQKSDNFVDGLINAAERLSNVDTILMEAAGRVLDGAESSTKEFYTKLKASFVSFQEALYGKLLTFGNNIKEGARIAAAVIETIDGVAQKADAKLKPMVQKFAGMAKDGMQAFGDSFKENYNKRKAQASGEHGGGVATVKAPKASQT